jgi:ABC-type oligopeptide transport system substrate-binding subunit
MPHADRIKKAQQLYREAGYDEDNPLQTELRYNTHETHRQVALAVQSMWSDALGVETRLINEEFQVLLANLQQKEVTQIFRLNWDGDYNWQTCNKKK